MEIFWNIVTVIGTIYITAFGCLLVAKLLNSHREKFNENYKKSFISHEEICDKAAKKTLDDINVKFDLLRLSLNDQLSSIYEKKQS